MLDEELVIALGALATGIGALASGLAKLIEAIKKTTLINPAKTNQSSRQ